MNITWTAFEVLLPMLVTGSCLAVLGFVGITEGRRAISLGAGCLTALFICFGWPAEPLSHFGHSITLLMGVICATTLLYTVWAELDVDSEYWILCLGVLGGVTFLPLSMKTFDESLVERLTEQNLWLTAAVLILLMIFGLTMVSNKPTRRTSAWTQGVAFAGLALCLIHSEDISICVAVAGCSGSAFACGLFGREDPCELKLLSIGFPTLACFSLYTQSTSNVPALAVVCLLLIPALAIGSREDDERRHRFASVVISVCLAIAAVGMSLQA